VPLDALNRELIRLANRNGLNADQVKELVDLAEHLAFHATESDYEEYLQPQYVYDFWKESYDVEP